MHILIIGAAGMIGRKLTQRLASDGALGGAKITEMTLTDVFEPVAPKGFGGAVTGERSDLSNVGVAES